jgi:hypothetical protein
LSVDIGHPVKGFVTPDNVIREAGSGKREAGHSR